MLKFAVIFHFALSVYSGKAHVNRLIFNCMMTLFCSISNTLCRLVVNDSIFSMKCLSSFSALCCLVIVFAANRIAQPEKPPKYRR